MTGTPDNLQLALRSAAILRFRHGFDHDHSAAISDITGVQTNRWIGLLVGLLVGLLEAARHAATVALLGSAGNHFSTFFAARLRSNFSERTLRSPFS